ncbi:hypothetical protein JCM10049v2_003419 [Rhodotorula toruloides]
MSTAHQSSSSNATSQTTQSAGIPWLSRKEAEEAAAHFDHEVPGWSNDVESIAQWLRKLLGRPVTQEILQDFTEGNKHPLDFSAAQDALGAIREVEFGRKTAGLELDDAFRDCDVFTIVNHVWSTVQPLAPSKELWFGGWIHRLAILLHLTQ